MDEVKEAEETAKSSKEKGSESGAHNSKAAKTKAAKNAAKRMKQKIRSLRRLLVSRLQIIATILASIMWSPDVPPFLVDALRFVTNIFTINVPGLLTSVDCLGGGGEGGMDPINKWYLQLFFPFGLLVVFFLWYRCLPPKSIAKSTVKEASIQVGFVWLFETIVTSSLKSLDCTPGTPGKLIMNPEQDCPLSGGNAGIAMLGILVLGAYVVAPYFWLASHRSFGFCAGCFSNTRKCYQGKGCCACCIEGVVLSGQTYYTPERCSKVRVGGLVGKLYFVNEM